MSGEQPTIVDLRGVEKRYDNGTHALAAIDLDVRRGEFLTLLGPSGCGKSTLLNLIAGLSAPSRGTIEWHKATPADPPPKLAFVFQAPTLMPWARVDANVRLPLDLAHVERQEADRAVEGALRTVGLESFARHFPRELSGGMQMRASIARALVTSPGVMLMDEPFGALDEFTRQRLDYELSALWKAHRLTVIFVTHSIAEAVFLSTRVAVMDARPGRILDEITIDVPFPRDDAFRVSTTAAEYARRLSQRVAAASAAASPVEP